MGKTQIAVGLDAGSSRTRCVICLLEDDHIRLLSYGLSHSAGWQKGRVMDQEAVAASEDAFVEPSRLDETLQSIMGSALESIKGFDRASPMDNRSIFVELSSGSR